MTETESQSWGEVADEQAAGNEAAEGRSCRSCGGHPDYIGTQDGERWYRCESCDLEQTEAELDEETTTTVLVPIIVLHPRRYDPVDVAMAVEAVVEHGSISESFCAAFEHHPLTYDGHGSVSPERDGPDPLAETAAAYEAALDALSQVGRNGSGADVAAVVYEILTAARPGWDRCTAADDDGTEECGGEIVRGVCYDCGEEA